MTMVGIVTDTVACLPERTRGELGIEVVPVHLIVDGTELRDGIDVAAGDPVLESAASVANASPTVEEWREAFVRTAERGADAIIVVAVSRRIASAFDGARLAATTVPSLPVHVVDSASAGPAEGLLVRRLAERAAEGWGAPQLLTLAEASRGRYHFAGVLAGLGPLGRSGRLPIALARLGDRLDLKAVIELDGDGRVHLRALVRGLADGVERIRSDVVSRTSPGEHTRLVVTDARLGDEAALLADRLAAALPAAEVTRVPLSAVMEANTGPLVGVAWEDVLDPFEAAVPGR